ncbi:hypothetical protein SAMN05216262_104204 [Colwellia chukchiensis]|uniref:DUF4870 domain-containing protein n=1 Tax=Colwellia chukchiensis TaxID=641665 RepID=A0A1H7LMS0_9GAMM|nr:hypothetical protein [Colwellia chukchiensis]SEL00028.1 hypothetical protein SAMN05216262_104204 [Colwellia chukchiensis]
MNMQARIQSKEQVKKASGIALWSILNLTFLPGLSFIMLLLQRSKVQPESLSARHLGFAIKLNLAAAAALIFVSILMIMLGGFNSGWTWVFVITYFVLVHTVFIVIAVWALIRAWAGNTVLSK